MLLTDFLNADFPEATPADEFDIEGPGRFFNRELSWLAFNRRVIDEASSERIPLLERVRYLSISASNLDEFYSVRVAGLRELAIAGNTAPSMDGLTASEQLRAIDADARALMNLQQAVWAKVRAELAESGIIIAGQDDLDEGDRKYLASVFMDQVFPVLTPLAIDPAHPFPFIPNEGFSLALQLSRKSDKRPLQALLPIPHQICLLYTSPSPRDA